MNQAMQKSWLGKKLESDENQPNTIIEYSHLLSVDITDAHMDYMEQFLLETKTHLPRLIELKVDYKDLKTVTMNFKRDAMRHNFSKVKQLIVHEFTILSNNVYQYFALL